ncbi:26S proteasome non-ATPase regulatory subunit 11 [Trichoplax sp. H2]|uniref:PCI domain-containing protein n=1 Tax=Trichoplax adhaerens TaxID=10228 RepID=B3S6F5_TRIAD|nr:hypothetical protein TRIADDRAFT_59787 [Trichoplax adhaerens]EDV21750.1 hypothetical protein TRIADDRAFT_59787 [Trichoplax adhaerens]RDD47493.1 26S proteasome non-ATPase regulatory subunit 11 [Trichoplax sp. H2]|eukprot:XP_002115898.1 hypothetical protein TRIADDRAFT_59787 [Trichoplax adhaerens]
MVMEVNSEWDEIEKELTLDPDKAIKTLSEIVQRDIRVGDENGIKLKEKSVLALGSLLAKRKQSQGLADLITATRPFLSVVSKAKAARLVKELVDLFLSIKASTTAEIQLCLDCIEWAKNEKRSYLRQALESRLIGLYYENSNYVESLSLSSKLLKELKKLDDKELLVEVQLIESKVYHAVKNIPKARAALTAARTTANTIYCPPKLQASLDLQSGILHAEEKDFKTSFSYFYEAFEGYDSIDDSTAKLALKYMLLCKIMVNSPDDVKSIISGKLALRYAGVELEAMKSIATAGHNRSLSELEEATKKYKQELTEDPIIQSHLDALYDNLLEQNLLRIIEPYSRVEVEHVASIIKLSLNVVERKLSQMILDKKFYGIMDQSCGVLTIYEEPQVDQSFEAALETISNMGKVVDALYEKAKKLL